MSEKLSLTKLLRKMAALDGSDLHISAGAKPRIRQHGSIVELEDIPALSPDTCKDLILSSLTATQKKSLEANRELDLSFGLKGVSRFRGNIYFQRGSISGAFRKIPFRVPDPKDVGIPDSLFKLLNQPKGLILITGPTGSGKSTTLATMVDYINRNKPWHIVTIEDPIEFIHQHKKSLINQREVHSDTASFSKALKFTLRQDPDCVMVGEMRDLETIRSTLTIAETGHLTLASIHTNSAISTINRVIDVFPPHQQDQVRVQLSFVFSGVLSQILVPHKNGRSRILITELLVPNQAIRNLIREDKVHQIYGHMLTGQASSYMYTLNQSLAQAHILDLISEDDAHFYATDTNELIKNIDQFREQGVPEALAANDFYGHAKFAD